MAVLFEFSPHAAFTIALLLSIFARSEMSSEVVAVWTQNPQSRQYLLRKYDLQLEQKMQKKPDLVYYLGRNIAGNFYIISKRMTEMHK